jgi:hypothetical protein
VVEVSLASTGRMPGTEGQDGAGETWCIVEQHLTWCGAGEGGSPVERKEEITTSWWEDHVYASWKLYL